MWIVPFVWTESEFERIRRNFKIFFNIKALKSEVGIGVLGGPTVPRVHFKGRHLL